MAKIEMDISEYEAMKENKLLLEKSLEREKILSLQINELNEDKIKNLELAQKQVVKNEYVKTGVGEITFIEDNDNSIYELREYFYNDRNRMYNYRSFEDIVRSFFKISYKEEHSEFHSFIGMSDAEKEIELKIKKQYESILDSYKEKEKTFKKSKDLIIELKNNIQTLSKENSTTQDSLNTSNEKNNELEEQCKKMSDKVEEIYSVIKNGYNFFNKSEKLKKILLILKKK